MTPELWQRVDCLFDEALSLESGQRTAFLDKACAGDPTVRAEVESLLQHHDRAEEAGFLEASLDGSATQLNTSLSHPTQVSPQPILPGYEILGELGRGGMGVVYQARQKGLNRLVALKMIRAGAEAGPQELARFKVEAEAAARLQHPHIVQIHEVGETDGRPFFCLEYVPGGSLAQQLDGTPWPARQAAALLETLARAAHHAHQHGVVHRDLKPGNILLAPNPQTEAPNPKSESLNPKSEKPGLASDFGFRISDFSPKVTDFGLAKRLDEPAGQTRSGDILGSPSYMAPEQAEGRAGEIGPRTDVYALGAILYELLTGRPPFRGVSALDTLVQVRSQEPVPPSRLQPKVPRDLETICLQSLQKEPRKRYPSAAGLADDLRRFLAGEPIEARPVGAVERLGRWCRRKPLVAGLAGGLVLVFLAGFAGVTWQWLRAERERERAEQNFVQSEQQRLRARQAEARAKRRFEQVRQLAHKFIYDFHDQIQDLAGSTKARKMLVKTALKYLDNLAQEAGNDPALLFELATAYGKMGDVQGNPSYPNLGDTTGALASYRKGLGLALILIKTFPEVTKAKRLRPLTYNKIGDIEAAQGRTAQALATYRRGLAFHQALAQADPTDPLAQRDLSVSYDYIGNMQSVQGQTAQALVNFRRSLAIRQRLAKADPTNALAQRDLSICHCKIGDMQAAQGHNAQALASYRWALEIRRRLAKADPTNALAQRDLSGAYTHIGDLQAAQGHKAQAFANYQRGLAIDTVLAKADPTNVLAQRDLSSSYSKIGDLQAAQGQKAEALASFRQSLAIDAALAKADPKNAQAQCDLAVSSGNVAAMLALQGQAVQALAQFQASLRIWQALAQADPQNANAQRGQAEALFNLGEMKAQMGADVKRPRQDRIKDWQDAKRWYRQARDAWVSLRTKGMLPVADAPHPVNAAKAISQCDRAIAELTRSGT
jgi:tetratricopeptide (TPR) repeat protein